MMICSQNQRSKCGLSSLYFKSIFERY